LAGSGLFSSFWLDAVLTRQYLCNHLPTSTLPNDVTPFESFTNGRKPDLSHLRVWGCECFVAVPDELRLKAGFKCFRAIFVGYEEHRVGWRVRDLNGKYSFSNDVIFNENLSGRLGIPRSVPNHVPSSSIPSRPVSPRLPRTTPRVRTAAGRAFDATVQLRDSRIAACASGSSDFVDSTAAGGAVSAVVVASSCGGVVDDESVVSSPGGVASAVDDVPLREGVVIPVGGAGGVLDGPPGVACMDVPVALDEMDTQSLGSMEFEVLTRHRFPGLWSDFSDFDDPSLPPTALAASSSSFSFHCPFDLTKFALSYSEAIACSDASIWRAVMDRERKSLEEMGAFEEVVLPEGERTIGLKWVFDHKTDSAGVNIPGKEKARLVAQGFNQCPGQFGETYAPVAKMASIHILLAWAAVRDLEIFQFDCKTAFLHAKIHHPIYVRQIPGYPLSDSRKVLRVLVALYSLRQSAYEFYMLFLSLLLELGMTRCEVDHGVFIGYWTSPPDPSVPRLADGRPLVLYVSLHVDDGLAITNSHPLYDWFLLVLSKRLIILDLGECSKFLSILIIRDCLNRHLWLSSHVYVLELLDDWNLSSCKPASTPFPSNLMDFSVAPSNSLPEIADADLLLKYQCIVGCLLYLAIATWPDISYYALWLGQFNANPTHRHFLAAKHVLHYLSGTRHLALTLGSPSPRVPTTLR
jgi:hypothetical protein